MKSIFASLILALFAVSVAGKEQHCIFRVHAEANPNDTPVFSSSVRVIVIGKQVAIERMPRLSGRVVVAFYLYSAGDVNYVALLELGEHVLLVRVALSIQ